MEDADLVVTTSIRQLIVSWVNYGTYAQLRIGNKVTAHIVPVLGGYMWQNTIVCNRHELIAHILKEQGYTD